MIRQLSAQSSRFSSAVSMRSLGGGALSRSAEVWEWWRTVGCVFAVAASARWVLRDDDFVTTMLRALNASRSAAVRGSVWGAESCSSCRRASVFSVRVWAQARRRRRSGRYSVVSAGGRSSRRVYRVSKR